MQNYIGFYWTLPVPWAGFRDLPNDADEASGLSRTIRYQRDRVRRWVKEEKGELIDETVFLETEPDRGSDRWSRSCWISAGNRGQGWYWSTSPHPADGGSITNSGAACMNCRNWLSLLTRYHFPLTGRYSIPFRIFVNGRKPVGTGHPGKRTGSISWPDKLTSCSPPGLVTARSQRL